jgi:hypothetical protein
MSVNDVVLKAQSGDQSAFRWLLKKYTPFFERKYRETPLQGYWEEKKDVFQDFSLALHKAVLTFQPEKGTQFMSWLYYRINSEVDLRKRKRKSYRPTFETYEEESISSREMILTSEDHLQNHYLRPLSKLGYDWVLEDLKRYGNIHNLAKKRRVPYRKMLRYYKRLQQHVLSLSEDDLLLSM